MKGKLIKCTHFYALRIDSDIIAVSLDKETPEHKVNYKHSLSKQNCNKIFEVIDIKKLANERSKTCEDYDVLVFKTTGYYHGFQEGFEEAIELNKDKLYTIEDIRKAMSAGLSIGYGRQFEISDKQFEIDAYTQELQLPLEIDVELEMEEYLDNSLSHIKGEIPVFKNKLKLDTLGCLILKRVL